MLAQRKFDGEVGEETFETLMPKLGELGGELLAEVVLDYEKFYRSSW